MPAPPDDTRHDVIASAEDDRLKHYRSLNDADLRTAFEEGEGIFIVEGITAIGRLLHSALEIESVLVTPERLARLDIPPHRAGVPILVADRTILRLVVGFDLHRGAVAVARRPANPDLAHVLRTARTLAVLEDLSDHENLGAIARSARAFGIDALVLSPRCADPYYRRCVRVSMGELLHLPVVRCETWPAPLAEMASAGFRVLALTPSGEATIDDLATERPERVAIMLGTEGPGLTDTAMAAATDRVRIPISAEVDSLNVGHAAAVAFHLFGRGATK